MSGKLIVIDGLDGSGKATQAELVTERLTGSGIRAKKISFPDYDDDSSALVKMYLRGDFGKDPGNVNAYAASSFYAVDRFASYERFWKEDYESGAVIICDRYTTSNAVHQMSKLPPEKWDGYLSWLYDYEYTLLGLPKPDAVLFLDMPLEVSQRLMRERYNGDDSQRDIHESAVQYLASCRTSAGYAASKGNWHVMQCTHDGELYSIETMTEKIMNYLYAAKLV